MAYDLLTSISRDADERASFRARRKFQMDLEHNQIVSFEEGKLEGILEGKLEGILEGKIKVAKNLLNGGLTVDEVARFADLSHEQVEKLCIGG